MIRILLVDDQNLVQQGIKLLIERDANLKVIGTVKDGRSAIKQIEVLRPDIVLLDIEMPGMNGITTTKYITHLSPQTKVIILSSHEDKKYLVQALMAGAKGYLLKSSMMVDLQRSIIAVHNGYSQVESRLLAKVFDPSSVKLRQRKAAATNNQISQQAKESQDVLVDRTSPKIEQTAAPLASAIESATPLKQTASENNSDNHSDSVVLNKTDSETRLSNVAAPSIIKPEENCHLESASIPKINLSDLSEADVLDSNHPQSNNQIAVDEQVSSDVSNNFLSVTIKQSASLSTETNDRLAELLPQSALQDQDYGREIDSQPLRSKSETKIAKFCRATALQYAPTIRLYRRKLAKLCSSLSLLIRDWYEKGWLANLGLVFLGTLTVLIIHLVFT